MPTYMISLPETDTASTVRDGVVMILIHRHFGSNVAPGVGICVDFFFLPGSVVWISDFHHVCALRDVEV